MRFLSHLGGPFPPTQCQWPKLGQKFCVCRRGVAATNPPPTLSHPIPDPPVALILALGRCSTATSEGRPTKRISNTHIHKESKGPQHRHSRVLLLYVGVSLRLIFLRRAPHQELSGWNPISGVFKELLCVYMVFALGVQDSPQATASCKKMPLWMDVVRMFVSYATTGYVAKPCPRQSDKRYLPPVGIFLHGRLAWSICWKTASQVIQSDTCDGFRAATRQDMTEAEKNALQRWP